MSTDCIAQVTFNFDPKKKPIVAAFDQPHASSDGGALLLKGIDTQWGLTRRLAACLADDRQPGKVRHQTLELLRQRLFGLACGYADCNDAARLADDAIHKLLLERDPLAGPALASQPTLSRFENAVGARELIAMGHVLADAVIEHHRRRLRGRATRITIDLDPTDDPTHGQQEFTFFNGHYDTWCYLPVVATVTFTAEAEQYAVAAVLRPGNAPASRGACGLLRRVIRQLRAAFHAPTIRVRLDGGFATPTVFAFLEAAQVEYVVGMPSNTRLEKRPPLDGQSADARQGHRPDRAPLWGAALRGQDVEAQAAGDHQGRGRAASRAGSQEQSSVRRDQPAPCAPDGLRGDLLPARRRGESAQGAASR